jgi:hypothetical protein
MTFTDDQQQEHRAAFINECRQKAWGAAAHADWISKGLDGLMAEYVKLKEEDNTVDADIKEAEAAIDSHTVDNRTKQRDARAPQPARQAHAGPRPEHGARAESAGAASAVH